MLPYGVAESPPGVVVSIEAMRVAKGVLAEMGDQFNGYAPAAVLHTVCDYIGNESGVCKATQPRLARESGRMSRSTLQDALKLWQELGILDCDARGGMAGCRRGTNSLSLTPLARDTAERYYARLAARKAEKRAKAKARSTGLVVEVMARPSGLVEGVIARSTGPVIARPSGPPLNGVKERGINTNGGEPALDGVRILTADGRNELKALRSKSIAAARYAIDPTRPKAEPFTEADRERCDELAAIESAEKAAEAGAQRLAYDEAQAAKLKALADGWDESGPAFATTDPRRPFKLPGAVMLGWMRKPEFDGVKIESLLRQFAEQFAADKTKRRPHAKTESWLLSFLRQQQKGFTGTMPPLKPTAARGARRW